LNFSASTNRLSVDNSTYDNAGNQTYYADYTLGYDAENRMVSVTSTSSGSGSFLYDGDGRRVKKVWTSGGTTVNTSYVYDANGKRGGRILGSNRRIADDILCLHGYAGSVRAVTNSSGTLIECYDYLPFGRMPSSSDNGRTSCYPPAPDSSITSKLPDKFTGKNVIPEPTSIISGLGTTAGHKEDSQVPILPNWTAFIDNPQSWNQYSYAYNEPFQFGKDRDL